MPPVLRRRIIVETTGRPEVERLRDSTRGLVDEGERLSATYRDANGRLRDAKGRFVGAGDAAQGMGRQVARANREVGLLGRGFDRLKGAVLAYLSVQAAQQVARGAADMFELGAAVGETEDAFRRTFEEGAPVLDRFFDRFANMAGMTKTEAREMSVALGGIGRGFGMTGEAAASFAEQVITLAGDISSLRNVPIGEVLRAMQSGLVGEVEPMRKYGVNLEAAAVEARALADRTSDMTGELSQQEKVMARLALMFEGTEAAADNLVDTQDSNANRARRLRAEFREQAEELAERLLPTFGFLLDLLSEVADGSDEAKRSLAEMAASGFHTAVTEGIVLIQTLRELGGALNAATSLFSGTTGAVGIMGRAWQWLIGLTQSVTSLLYIFGAALAVGREGLFRLGGAAARVVGQTELADWFREQADAASDASAEFWNAAMTVGDATDEIRRRAQDAVAATAEAYSAIGEMGELVGPDLSRILGDDGPGGIDTSNLKEVDEILARIKRSAKAAGEALKMPEALDLRYEINRLGQDVTQMWEEIVDSLELPEIDTSDLDVLKRTVAEVERAARGYREEIARIDALEAAGMMTAKDAARARERATDEHRAQLTQITADYEVLLAQYPGLAEAIQQALREIDPLHKGVASLSDKVGSLAAGARGVLRLADAFGDLDEKTKDALESTIDLLDGISRVASNPADIGGWVQAIGGAVGVLEGLFGGESAEARRARLELQRELRDNARALADLTEAIRAEAQVGTDITQGQAAAGEALLRVFEGIVGSLADFSFGDISAFDNAAERLQELVGSISAVNSLFEQLAGLGIEEDLVRQFQEQFNALVQSGQSPADALEQLLSGPDGLLAVIGGILDSIGDYADSVEGQIERIRDSLRFLGLSGDDAVGAFIEGLLDNVGDLTPEMEDLLRQMLDLDLSTSDGQAAFDALIAEMYRLGLASGLSVDELELLLSSLQDFASGVDEATEALSALVSASGIREAIEDVRNAVQFGGASLEDALAMLIERVQSLAGDATGPLLTDANGNTILDAFLDQIAGLNLNTADGQAALADIIRQMFDLGPGAFGMEEGAFLALLSQLQQLAGQFDIVALSAEGAAEALDSDPLQSAIDHITRALRYGAISLEDALAMLLQSIREAADGTATVFTGADGNSVLDSFLDQIAGLDLSTEEGQAALAEIIRQMFLMGASAFGLDDETFDLILSQLQNLGGQFELGSGEGSESNAVRAARVITEFQANKIIDVLEAILWVVERIAGVQPPAPPSGPAHTLNAPPVVSPGSVLDTSAIPPMIQPPQIRPPMVSPRPAATPGAAHTFGNVPDGWTPALIRTVDLDEAEEKLGPRLLRRWNRDLQREFGNR